MWDWMMFYMILLTNVTHTNLRFIFKISCPYITTILQQLHNNGFNTVHGSQSAASGARSSMKIYYKNFILYIY